MARTSPACLAVSSVFPQGELGKSSFFILGCVSQAGHELTLLFIFLLGARITGMYYLAWLMKSQPDTWLAELYSQSDTYRFPQC